MEFIPLIWGTSTGVHTVDSDSDSVIRAPNHDSLSTWIDANEYGILIVPKFAANKN